MAGRVQLEKRRQTIHRMTREGKTQSEIASRLHISVSTVQREQRRISDSERATKRPTGQSTLDAHLRAKMLEISPQGFKAFFDHYAGYPEGLIPLHENWVERAFESNRTLINCPPRHAKSEIFTVWMPIWLASVSPDIQILIISQTDKLAKKFTNKIAYHLGRNERLINDFGPFRPEEDAKKDTPWRPNSGELLVARRNRATESGDLTIQVRGSQQQILGMETDWLIVDDVVSRETATSEAMREKLSDWFHGDVMSRLEPESRAVVIGQRLHVYDLYGELSEEVGEEVETRGWNHINYPAVQNWETEQVLWPERWSFEKLMQKRRDVGQDMFECMYQQNPLPEGRRLTREDWLYGNNGFAGCIDTTSGVGERNAALSEDGAIPVRVVSLDPSPTRFAGLIVCDVYVQGDTYAGQFDCRVIEAVRERMSVRDMVAQLDRVIAMYRPDYFIFEAVAAQRWFLQDRDMERISRQLRVLPHTTNVNKADPTLGVESLALDFEFGRIIFPYADAESRTMTEMVFDEARTWPQGHTDDLLMALWFVKYNYGKGRLIPPSSLHNAAPMLRPGARPQSSQRGGAWGWLKEKW